MVTCCKSEKLQLNLDPTTHMLRVENHRNIGGCSDFISFSFLSPLDLSGTPGLKPALAWVTCPGMQHKS